MRVEYGSFGKCTGVSNVAIEIYAAGDQRGTKIVSRWAGVNNS